MADFNVEAAKKAGYSDTEIAEHLATSRGFDIAGARKSGYSDGDVISHLSGTAKAAEKPGFLSRAYDATIGGILHTGKEILDKGAPRVIDEMGTALVKRTMESKAPGPLKLLDTLGSLIIPDQVFSDVHQGNYAGAAGGFLGNAAMVMGPNILKGAGRLAEAGGAARTARLASAPVEQVTSTFKPTPMTNAAEYANSIGAGVTRGEATGSKMYQAAERAAPYTPGASGVAEDFYNTRNAQLLEQPQGVIKSLGGGMNDAHGAGAAARDEAMGVIQKHGAEGDAAYQSVRDRIEAKQSATKSAQADPVGPEQEPGLGYTKKAPVEKAVVAPVEMAPVRKAIKGLYEELRDTLVDTQKASSPGWNRIKQLYEHPDKFRSALDIDRDLSEIKGIVRNDKSQYVKSQSARYAFGAIDALEGQLQKVIVDVGGPEALNELKTGRAAVAKQHIAASALKKVLTENDSPANLMQSVTERGDKNIYALEALQKVAPQGVNEIAATKLTGVLNKIRGEGGNADMAGALAEYNSMGPRTKAAFYGAAAAELDSFFEHAPKLIQNLNKSGTAPMSMGAKTLGLAGAMIGTFLTSPVHAVEGAAAAGAMMTSANLTARWLFKPGNAKLLQNTMRTVKTPAAFEFYAKRLNAAIEADPGLAESLRASRIAKPDAAAMEQQ